MNNQKRIAFISPIFPKYKAWICEELNKALGDRLFVVHGPEAKGAEIRDVGTELAVKNNHLAKNSYIRIGGIEITWSAAVLWVLKNRPDIVILSDQVRILSNYPIFLWARLTKRRVIFYSHGYNHQAHLFRGSLIASIVERVRMIYLRRADAIIVYDQQGAEHLRQNGVVSPIYNSKNTLDTRPVMEFYENLSYPKQLGKLRQDLGLNERGVVITFVGRLVQGKRVDFFVDVIKRLTASRAQLIQGLVIGDGPQLHELSIQAESHPIRFDGTRDGPELWTRLAVSDLVFVPGMVGLAIVDAFCAGCPFLTVDQPGHGPEICYLKPETNGILLQDFSVEEAVSRIQGLLGQRDVLGEMGRQAKKTAIRECGPEDMRNAFISAISCDTPPQESS